MERDIYNGRKEISTVFDHVDADLVTLSESMQKCHEKEAVLVESSKKQEKNLEEMLHCLAALENGEEEREMRITLQEDLIQQLQDELVIVQGAAMNVQWLGVVLWRGHPLRMKMRRKG